MDSRELKARGNCFERVISDIVKRRSFRVSIVISKEIAAGTHSRHFVQSDEDCARCFVGSVPDRRESSVRSCKLVFLISVPPVRVETQIRLRTPSAGWALIMRAIK